MPSIREIGPITQVRETDEEVLNKYATEVHRCNRIYRWFESQGRENEPEAIKCWDRMNEIWNMYNRLAPFVREGTDYFAKGMIGEISLYRRIDFLIKEPIALNPPDENPSV
jgi:hypothetical protein